MLREDLNRLEQTVLGLIYLVRVAKLAGRIDAIRVAVSTTVLVEMIELAQSIRQDYRTLLFNLLETRWDDRLANGGTGQAYRWINYMLRMMESADVKNRTLFIEKYWIRVLISITPFYLSIDYHDLSWANFLDREDCADCLD